MNITVLGTGAMGSRMAKRLVAANHTVTVWNRDAAKTEPLAALGAIRAASARESLANADIVLSMLRDDDASRELWFDGPANVAESLRPSALVLECSTISIAWAKEFAERARKHNILFLESPVLGSLPQVEAGVLVTLLGGDQSLVERAEPVVGAYSRIAQYTGKAGTAAAMKLFVNGMLATQVATFCQLLGFAERAGISRERASEIFCDTAAASDAVKAAAAKLGAQDYSPLFTTSLVEKDMMYLVNSAKLIAAHVPSIEATSEVFAQTVASGFGEEHITAVYKVFAAQQPEAVAR